MNLESISIVFIILTNLRSYQTKLIPVYNLKDIGDFEIIKDEYKILYKEHFYNLKELLDQFTDKNAEILLETYDKLFNILNSTRIDTSGEFVSIKYKLLKQLEDNKEDLMSVYMGIKYKINEVAYKLINYIEDNNINKQTLYFLEYTMEQAMRLLKNIVPHNKQYKLLQNITALPYMFLGENEVIS